jgi:hypothetical protein
MIHVQANEELMNGRTPAATHGHREAIQLDAREWVVQMDSVNSYVTAQWLSTCGRAGGSRLGDHTCLGRPLAGPTVNLRPHRARRDGVGFWAGRSLTFLTVRARATPE